MTQHVRVSKDTMQRLWAQNDLKPHLKKILKLSSDPEFEVKFWDLIGLYLNPPERAVVLCCEEKKVEPCAIIGDIQKFGFTKIIKI